MLEELIKLSKQLYKLDLSHEATEIEAIVERLFGMPSKGVFAGDNENCEEEATPSRAIHLDSLSQIISDNTDDQDFVEGISEVLINNLDEDDLMSIITSLEEVVK